MSVRASFWLAAVGAVLGGAVAVTPLAAETTSRWATASLAVDGSITDQSLSGSMSVATDRLAPYDPDTVHVAMASYHLDLVGPDGAPIQVGSYEDVRSAAEPTAGHAGLTATPSVCGTTPTTTFEVLEVVRVDGVISQLAVDYDVSCPDGRRVIGQVRYKSGLATVDVYIESSNRDLGWVDIGDTAEVEFLVQARGATPVTIGAASFSGPGAGTFSVVGGGCTGVVVTFGDPCQFTVRFAPTAPGLVSPTLTLETTAPLGARRFAFTGDGRTPVALTISAPAAPVFSDGSGTTRVVGQVSPAPTGSSRGTMAISSSWYHSPSIAVAADGSASFDIPTSSIPFGTSSFQVSYSGGGDQRLALIHVEGQVTRGYRTSAHIVASDPSILTTETTRLVVNLESPDYGTISGGTITVVDLSDGRVLDTRTVPTFPSSNPWIYSFDASFPKPGTREVRVAYAGAGLSGPSSATTTVEVLADVTVAAAGQTATPATFYPVIDQYRDTLRVAGELSETARVVVRVYTSSGTLVHTVDLGSRTAGAYATAWNGRSTTGAIRPEGTYRVVQTITDGAGNKKTTTHYATLSKKKLYWKTVTVSKTGEAYTNSGSLGSGYVSRTRSSYTTGVRIYSGGEYAAVSYQFTLRSAAVYGSITFKALGKSPNGKRGYVGLWRPTRGHWNYVENYDLRVAGPAYGWYSYVGSTVHRSGRDVAGVVAVTYDAPGTGGKSFDVAKVSLTYRYATLAY